MSRKTRIALTVVGAGLLSLAALAPTAQAGSPLCPGYTNACVYLDAGFNGLFGTKQAGSGLTNISTTNNDRMSSWENKSRTLGAWYANRDGGGACRTMYAVSEASYSWLDGINDTMSSWKMNGSC